MLKRGQVTIFIVISILIIFLIAGIFLVKTFLVGEELKEVDPAPMLSNSIKSYIESCIEQTGKKALTFVAQQGGYYELPPLSEFGLPYYFYENKSRLISKKELEQQISSYINNELFFCIQNFVPFKKAGLDIEQKEIIASAKISKEKVRFEVTFPVTIQQDALSKSIAYFSETVPSPLGVIYNMTAEFMRIQEEDPGRICVSCLSYLGAKNNLRTEMNLIYNNTVQFTIIDETKPQEPFEYLFLNRYEFAKEER